MPTSTIPIPFEAFTGFRRANGGKPILALDPQGLLEVPGKSLRHIKIKSVAEARSPHVEQLVWASIAEE
jgi:hypothetical protein